MKVQSKIDGKNWLWVNVPKTASTAVMRTFFPSMGINEQQHNSYEELIQAYGNLDAFTTVRHPVTRFKSALNHTCHLCMCGQCTFSEQYVSTLDVIYLNVATENANIITKYRINPKLRRTKLLSSCICSL